MRLRYFLNSIIFIVLFSTNSHAQNFEWLKKVEQPISSSGISSMPNGGCAVIVPVYSSSISGSYSITVDSLKLNSPNFKGLINYAVTFDSNGLATQAIPICKNWVKKSFNSGYYNIKGFCSDDSGNFYITTYLTDSFSVVGNDTFYATNGRILFAKFDKNFRFIKAIQTGNSTYIYLQTGQCLPFACSPKTELKYINGHLLFMCISTGATNIGTKVYNLNTGLSTIFGELDINNFSILWSNCIYSPNKLESFRITGLTRLKSNLFLSGDFGASFKLESAIIGKDTVFSPGGFILKMDTIGNHQQILRIRNNNYFNLHCIETDGENLFIGGFYRDSLQWGNGKISPMYSTGGQRGKQYKLEFFAASIDPSLKHRWFYRPPVFDTGTIWKRTGIFTNIKHCDGYLYYGGIINEKVKINGQVIGFNSSSLYYGNLICKIDHLGNVLWPSYGGGGYIEGMDVYRNKSVFACGYFSGKLTFGKHTDSTRSAIYLTKLTDYSISRGAVKQGPYCAGDTIKIPFTIVGEFDTSNIFTAQLSDENGNFESGYRNLGYLKHNKAGTIIGNLPLFKVKSSPNYRIRILGSNPAIQSYYRRDSLRLLIYSRDKADPGPAETICRGDSIRLNTFGGTKWNWSPNYNINKTQERQPLVWPNRDTVYRIIISDSSGCGETDTAFKTIKLRAFPKAQFSFSDTILCDNGNISIPVSFSGGDSNYRWQWFMVDKGWFPWKKGTFNLNDTLNFSTSASVNNPEILAVILHDGCTKKADTAYITIRLNSKIEIISSLKDTTLCYGQNLKYLVSAKGGTPDNYSFQWCDKTNGKLISKNDTLKIPAQKSMDIQVNLSDGCNNLSDSLLFHLKVLPALKLNSNLQDTSICSGSNLSFFTNASGGVKKNYSYKWRLGSVLISDSASFIFKTNNYFGHDGGNKYLTIWVSDQCSPPDSVRKLIEVKENPVSSFSNSIACDKIPILFYFNGSKPPSPVKTIFRWNFNNQSTSNLEFPAKTLTPGKQLVSLILDSDNGCSDTSSKMVDVKTQAVARFEVQDGCENDSIQFINSSVDAISAFWKFGDGNFSQVYNPKHLFKVTGRAVTYNISLVAGVPQGCSDSITLPVTINPMPSSDFSYTRNGTTINLKAEDNLSSYFWKFGFTDSLLAKVPNHTHITQSNDQFNVCLKVIDNNGCTSQTCKNTSIGLALPSIEDKIRIYPNPTNGNFNIAIDNKGENVLINVFSMEGKLIKNIEGKQSLFQINLPVKQGLYLIQVISDKGIYNFKLQVKS